jgi:biofilm protein TabA
VICDLIENIERYRTLHTGFAEAFAFLRRSDLQTLPIARYPINGDRVFAMVARDQGRDKDEAQLEVHDKFIDIQMVLAGMDEMGWSPRSMCREPAGPYDPEGDIGYFEDAPAAWFQVREGMFAIFFPDDAHLPLISSGLIHKVVVKVAVDKG